MAKVGIKELKAKLSEYVERARGGETVVVTDRGEPVAELVPLSPTRRKLLQLAEEGELSWNGGKPKGLRGIVVRGEPVSETVIRARR
ncbi:MAG TPA: type II toxin-antitoxin system prevent-host-death family antitoxin [Thermoanaerobaculia bacterium]